MKSNHCNIDGKLISYLDRGEGKPVVLVHCSSACYREWLPLIKSLPKQFRVLAPDLWGYGKSERFGFGETFNEQIDVKTVSHMLDLCEEPAHVIGHSYGGALAIEAARLNPLKVETLTLIEPSCFQLLQKSPECQNEWQIILDMAKKMVSAVDHEKYREAMDVYMSFFMGDEEWASTSEDTKERLSVSLAKVAGEFSSLEFREMGLEDYRNINAPVTFIQGAKTRCTARKVIELLNGVIRDRRVVEIPGAGHMSPMTHARQVVDIVMDSLMGKAALAQAA